MHRLQPVLFHDAWGSHVSIASLRGEAIPSAQPESELWMGAHESGPAGLVDQPGTTLAELIAEDPVAALGEDLDRFGARLPFLLKVLAPGRAISIQTHPTAQQAQEARRRDGDSLYVDDWAKPELLLAIAPFEVFVGLRTRAEVEAFVERLDVPELTAAVEATREADSPVHALLSSVLHTPPSLVQSLTRRVVAACVRVESVDDEFGDAAAAIVRVAEDHPDDLGLAVLPLMHHRTLQPGEFIDVAAGVLHSYVRGLGIEVLANSDNVVRAGLTNKAVNVPELLRVIDPAADGVAGQARDLGEGRSVFESGSDRFVLHRLDASHGPVAVPGAGGPRIVFCLRGRAELSVESDTLSLRDMESVFVPAVERDLVLSGSAEAYVVSTPRHLDEEGATR